MLRPARPSGKRKNRVLLRFIRTLKIYRRRPWDKMDTTDYLMSSPANRESLLQAIYDIENNKNVLIYRDLIEV